MSGTLFIVATPIGNLEDLSPRARQTLAEADLIAAEDTRRTGRLLSHLGIKTQQYSLHDHNEDRATASLIEALKSGKSVALVSDAGTPLVSDPGYRLVNAAHSCEHTGVTNTRAIRRNGGIVGLWSADGSFLFRGFRTVETRCPSKDSCVS